MSFDKILITATNKKVKLKIRKSLLTLPEIKARAAGDVSPAALVP